MTGPMAPLWIDGLGKLTYHPPRAKWRYASIGVLPPAELQQGLERIMRLQEPVGELHQLAPFSSVRGHKRGHSVLGGSSVGGALFFRFQGWVAAFRHQAPAWGRVHNPVYSG